MILSEGWDTILHCVGDCFSFNNVQPSPFSFPFFVIFGHLNLFSILVWRRLSIPGMSTNWPEFPAMKSSRGSSFLSPTMPWRQTCVLRTQQVFWMWPRKPGNFWTQNTSWRMQVSPQNLFLPGTLQNAILFICKIPNSSTQKAWICSPPFLEVFFFDAGSLVESLWHFWIVLVAMWTSSCSSFCLLFSYLQIFLANNNLHLNNLLQEANEMKEAQDVLKRIQNVADKFFMDLKSIWGNRSAINLSDISGSVRSMGKRKSFSFANCHSKVK